MSNNPTLSDVIIQLREDLGFSRDDLANQLGVHVRTVTRWEEEGAEPRGDGIRARLALLARNTSVENQITKILKPSSVTMNRMMGVGVATAAAAGVLGVTALHGLSSVLGGLKQVSDAKKGTDEPILLEATQLRLVTTVAANQAELLDVDLGDLGVALQEVILASSALGLGLQDLIKLCASWRLEKDDEKH
ncbi:helix-turn-helix domain-containing protein [Lujinxingia vulgaris]|uniref:Helix-turn-helix domain-containing protein n=1 Tax=Lujinxingia vulgaris TaxID=2600176 RepID=A0A5C6X952_9DELT|nr:helix-turn-helix domain-containing protein [Lujinxingia vulgaris]TXD33792.1 helix-turn-helix domain-containing protein [Lujinxingia vulgaris]